MRVLVTGAAGFVGFHTCLVLVEEGFSVVGLDNLSRGDAGRVEVLKGLGCGFIVADVRDFDAVAEAVRGVDAVVHCAALVNVPESFEKPLEYESVNVGGTVAMLEASARAGVERFVYVSSAAVYGDPVYLPVNERHPTRPKSPYGASKLAGEVYALSYSEAGRLDCVVLRLFNVYGPGQNPAYAGVVSAFVRRVLEGKPPVVYGDGEQTRDFVHVRDVARAVIAALTADSLCQPPVYNIGSGRPVRILDLARLVTKVAGVDLEPVFGPPRPGDIWQSCADVGRARRELKWEPQVSLEEGLRELLSGRSRPT